MSNVDQSVPKKLHEIVSEMSSLRDQFAKDKRDWINKEKLFNSHIESLQRLESLALSDTDIDKVQLAESVIYVRGNPYGKTDDIKTGSQYIAECAIIDIAKGCPHLKREFLGNKRYDGFYQRTDCNYGYGPKHGSIVDEIGLKDKYRQAEITDDQKDACIYYLRNYVKISSAKAPLNKPTNRK